MAPAKRLKRGLALRSLRADPCSTANQGFLVCTLTMPGTQIDHAEGLFAVIRQAPPVPLDLLMPGNPAHGSLCRCWSLLVDANTPGYHGPG